jgi:hypothetical protein
MKSFDGAARIAFLAFFVLHILATVCMDSQASYLLPSRIHPNFLLNFNRWYAETFQDPHFNREEIETWFRVCITVEVFFQLPYFVIGTKMMRSKPSLPHYPEWFRLLSLIYGAQAITAIVPILLDILFYVSSTLALRWLLFSFYLPFLLFPVALVVLAVEPAPGAPGFSTMTGVTKTVKLVFFVLHIPITIFIDSQAVLPHSWYPKPALDLVQWYTDSLQDELMTPPYALWFQTFIGSELLFQLPTVVIIIWQLVFASKQCYPTWFQTVACLYGTHVVSTLLPILTCIALNHNVLLWKRMITLGIYSFWTFFPGWLVVLSVKDGMKLKNNEKKEA